MDLRPGGPAEGEGGKRGRVLHELAFNMHSPGEVEQAALSAVAPVWPL